MLKYSACMTAGEASVADIQDVGSTGQLVLDIDELVRHIVKKSGKTPAQLSREISRSKGYVGSLLSHGTVPGLSVLADIAEACGYGVALISDDEAITVLPGESPATDVSGNKIDPWDDITRELSASRRVVVCMGELPEDEFADYPDGKAGYLRELMESLSGAGGNGSGTSTS